MTVAEIKDMFNSGKVTAKAGCSDLTAFTVLANLSAISGDVCSKDIIAAADRDMLFLRPSLEDIADKASVRDIETLMRCGVLYDNYSECLIMYF